MATFSRRHPPPRKRKDCFRYNNYRREVQEDFHGYCAHCGVHEDDWPHTVKNYDLDHFRPKYRFKDLENDFYNLYWCCKICNRADAKGENWPSEEEEAKGIGFVDLCVDDWQVHYLILSNGLLEPKTPKAKYTIDQIGLNDDAYVIHRLKIIRQGGSIFPPSGRRLL